MSIIQDNPVSVLEASKLLTPKKTAETCGISVRTLWRLLSSGQYPQPIRVGTRIVRWKVADVLAWINSQNGGSTNV